MISGEPKIIFFHNGKTAGTSIGYSVFGESYRHDRGLTFSRLESQKFDLSQYFKFCFVRNPWDRAVSFYLQMKKAVNLEYPPRLHAFKRATECSFPEFIKRVECENPALFTDESYYNKIFSARGSLGMDFTGRFENLEADYRKLAQKIPVKDPVLQHRNRSDKRLYTEYYDPESRRIVGRLFAFDIDYFGYTFSGKSACATQAF